MTGEKPANSGEVAHPTGPASEPSPEAVGMPEVRTNLSEAVDRVARHELERRLERLSGEMMRLRRTLAPLARFRTIIDQAGEEAVKAHLAIGRLPEMRVKLRQLESAVNKLRTEVAALDAPAKEAQRAA